MKVFDKKIWNDCNGMNAENWLSITKDSNIATITVVGAKGKNYSTGDLISEGEVLTITATPKENYTLKTLTVNGNAFTSGNTFTVYTAVSVVAESTNKYELTMSGENATISVKRSGDDLENNAEITYGDVLTISALPAEGYTIKTLTVNGESFISGSTKTVTGDVNVAVTTEPEAVE